MAIKRTRKKSGPKKNDDSEKDKIDENSENSLEVDNSQIQLKSIGKDEDITKNNTTLVCSVFFAFCN